MDEPLSLNVKVIRKNIRNLRLKITPEGDVVCSAPLLCPQSKIDAFIKEKTFWITKTLNRVRNAAQNNVSLRDDGMAFLLNFTEEDRKKNGRNFIYSRNWKEEAMKNFEHTVCRFLPAFEVGLLPQFELKGRAMHSMWGNCNTKTKVITLNWELFNFPQACIDYVVLHEMTHFLYIYHDRKFYGFIEKTMPDYKGRIKMMK